MSASFERIGLATVPFGGWGALRLRWEGLVGPSFGAETRNYHLEDWFTRYYTRVKFWNIWRSIAGWQAYQAAVRDGCDLLFFQTIHYAALLPRRPKLRIAIIGDATPAQLAALPEYPIRWDDGERRLYAKRLPLLGGDRYRHLVQSKWYEDGLATEYRIPRERCHPCPNGVTMEKWARPAPPEPTSRLRVLFLGGHFERKGGPLLLALSRREEFADCHFTFVTQSEHESSGNATFLSDLKPDTPELIATVQAQDVLMLPTKADCTPMSAAEAGAAEIPTIVSNIAATPEVVLNGETGFVVDEYSEEAFAQALRAYKNDLALLRRHGQAAKRHVRERFSWETMISGMRSAAASF